MSFFNPNKIIATADDFRQALKKGGMESDLRMADPAAPHIIVREAGIAFVICVSPIAFTFGSTLNARLGVDFDKIASWNSNKAFCNASYLIGEDKYMLTYALISQGGLLSRNAQALTNRWPERVNLFATHMGLTASDIVVPRHA